MGRDWENLFTGWSTGPGQTEKQRCENAEHQVVHAIRNYDALKERNIRVFVQGSYRNRVNVKRDSDVDIGVLCFDTFYPEYPDDNVKARLDESFSDSAYKYSDFKNDIERALVYRFGVSSVSRGNKSFDIRENSYRVEADVAAFFEHRRYASEIRYISGVQLIPDNGVPVCVRNWPEQHYNNGVSKNEATARRFKKMVRIVKSLSNEMADAGIQSSNQVPSFLIECLIWNTPSPLFSMPNYEATLREILAFLFNSTINDNDCNEWGEVSDLKYLFRGSQQWTRQDAHRFLGDVWDYVGYA